ncbi:MAG: hypothetical protein AAF546_08010 [Verrucomicrobiota bacterium]
MNPEFEEQCRQQMLVAVSQKKTQRRALSAATILLFVFCSAFLINLFLHKPSAELKPVPIVDAVPAPAMTERKHYTGVATHSDGYKLIQSDSSSYLVIRSSASPHYALLDEGELMAALPEEVGIRYEPDGSGTLLNLP